ncbi:transposable element Tcb2 transposase [Trichonephila clavipes]|nr:transposable element Tcb2 transposase [Trichonephila clavipes]
MSSPRLKTRPNGTAVSVTNHYTGWAATRLLAGQRAVLLARWIVRSVPIEIVGSSGHEKVNRVWSNQEDHEERGSKDRVANTCGPHSDSFNDTSRSDNRVRVWKRPGELYNSPHTVLRHTASTAGAMVWVAIAYDSRSTLIVMRGTVTSQRYVDDILPPHVGPFLNGLPGAIFQQDNARPHTERVAQDFLHHFQTLPWPARSPNLSSVEHVWDQLKRQMPSCHSVHDLELAVQDLWTHLPQDNIRCLINSEPDHVAGCNAAGGGPTRY